MIWKQNQWKTLTTLLVMECVEEEWTRKKSFLVILFAMSFSPTTSYNFLWRCGTSQLFYVCRLIFVIRYLKENISSILHFYDSIVRECLLMLLNYIYWGHFKKCIDLFSMISHLWICSYSEVDFLILYEMESVLTFL